MQKSATLAEVKRELATDHQLIIHSSLSLYILADRRPKPDNPDWIEVGCVNKGGAEGMMVHLSPLDALLEAKSRNSKGAKFHVQPFEAIDPRPYIIDHSGWLTLYLVYGFAGRGKRLVINQLGHLQAMIMGMHFQIGPDDLDHFHLSFSDKLIDYVNTLHGIAGIPDYARIIQDQADSTGQELEVQAQDALLRIEQPAIGEDDITHCAIYDPIDRQWRFASFDDLQAKQFGD